ncbi:MAG: hypothetical protein HY900_33325 [Deltaproteobacteria bacterium]|nr:hypothetical protein [Deltaproteobacteria bacterium]
MRSTARIGWLGRTLSFLAVLLLSLSSAALAAPVTVAWDPNPPAEGVTGYVLHYGTVSRTAPGFSSYTTQVDVGNVTQYTVDLASAGATYYLAVVAYNAAGLRSDYSAEISAVAGSTGGSFVITASAGSNGSISPSGAVTVAQGANQSFTLTPATGYRVATLTVDGASVAAATSYTFTNVTANHTISATFAVDTYTVTASAGANGTISPSGTVTVNRGANQSFTLTPATGYRVATLTVDGASVAAATSYTFTNVTANHTISATFAVDAATTYTVTASAGANGSISPSGAVTVNSGGSQTFTITPATGYHVAAVTVDGASAGAVTSYAFSNVTTNHTISATFAVDTYTVTASAGANGTVTPSGVTSVPRGGSLSLTITPADGYGVGDVQVNGGSVGAVTSYTLTNIMANSTVEATFVRTQFQIHITTTGEGTVTPQVDGSGAP